MKVTKCSVKNCRKPGTSLFRFPNNIEIREEWIKFCGNEIWWKPNTASRICSNHFEKEYITLTEKITRLEKIAVPTIKTPDFQDPSVLEFLAIQKQNQNPCYLISDTSVKELNECNPLREDNEDYMVEESSSIATVPLQEYDKLKAKNLELKKEILRLRKIIKNQDRKIKRTSIAKKKIKLSFLTSYQTSLVYKNQRSGKNWDKSTIREAICMRASCGTRGYNYLRKSGYPLPTIRFLNKKLQPLSFRSGILEDFIICLKEILETLDPLDRRCGLFFDEMSIIPGYEFDPATKTILGQSNFPGDPVQDATHGLVFILCGLRMRWKQLVAYYYTGKSHLSLPVMGPHL